MRVGVKPGQWGWSFEQLRQAWQAAEACGFSLLSCFDHASAAPANLPAWDAPSLLSVMAANTVSIRLAVHVVNTSLRNPFLLAGQLAVAQAASGGRLEVGLGAGSGFARLDHRAIGVPFPPFSERVARLEACCRILPRLWRGASVDDEQLRLKGASLGPQGLDPPPIIVGGKSERVIDIAARYADGWNADEPDPDKFGELVRRLDEACQRVGRERPIEKQVQIFLTRIDLSSIRERLERLREQGTETVVFVIDGLPPDPQAVTRLAAAVL